MASRTSRAGIAALLLPACVFLARGQSSLATVTGVVTDAADAVIAGVQVAIRNTATNLERTIVTGQTGNFTLTNLAPGTYELRAETEGFRIHRKTGIVLQVGQVLRADIRMELGAVSESVTVNASVTTLNTESGTIKGDVIVQAEIQELPLDGRDFTDLAFFVPGVVPRAQGGQGSALNINGARATNTNFYVDGFNNRNARGAAAQVRPNIDALQEFKMEVSGYSAEYGKMAGGILNMVLRSGTNDFHGTLFHYLRNDIYDARGFFEVSKNKLRRNQFGATVSGPLVRDRTFFLTSFEGYIQILANTRLGHTPSLTERAGDFSSSIDFLGQPIHLKDPLASGACNAKNRKGCFSNNVIPASRLDRSGLNILRYYPLPNRPDRRNNYVVTADDDDRWYSFLGKVDHRFSEKDSLSFRYQKRFNRTQNPFAGGSDLGTFGSRIRDDRSLAGMDWTRIFSPRFLMEFRGGFSRNSAFQHGEFQGQDVASQLGLPTLVSDPELLDFPRITVRDHFQIGTGNNQPVQYHVTDIQFNSKFTWIQAKHVFKGGFDVSRVRFNQPFFNNLRGTYNFLGRWTNSPVGDLLLGLPNNTSRQVGFNRNYYRSTSYGLFFNDDWKVTRTLTLNLGIRYEINKPPVDRYDKLANFIPGPDQVAIAGAAGVPGLPELVALAGLEGRVATRSELGLPRSLVYTDYTNFAPRVGFAWRAMGSARSVIRGGYGIFYGGEILNPLRNNLSNNFPFAINQNFNRLARDPALLTLRAPFPDSRLRLAGATNAFGYDLHAPSSYLQSWNLTYERELIGDSAIEIGYVGSKGTHLGRRYDFNQPVRTRELYEAGNGFPRPIEAFNAVNYFSWGTNSIYNSFQVSVRRRGRGDFFYRLNYSYSKSIDDASQLNGSSDGGFPNAQDSTNLKLDRGRSDFDIGHIFTAVFSWQVPAGRGRRYLSGGGVLDAMLGGWQLSGTARAYSGQPFTVRTADVDLNLGESLRPNRITKGNLPDDPARGKRGADFPWFSPEAFEQVPCADPEQGGSCLEQSRFGFQPFQFGNSGRNILDGPGLAAIDLGLRKTFALRERRSLQLRLDAFNILNRTNFLLPDNFFNSVTGGFITRVGDSGRQGGPRVFQAGLTYRF